MVGILGALAITGVESKNSGTRVHSALRLLQIENRSLQSQATIIGIIAAVLLIIRTATSIYLTRRILSYLSMQGAVLSKDLITKLLSQPLLFIQEKSSLEMVYALTSGVETIALRVLGNLSLLASDITLLIVLFLGLIIVDPTVAISTFIFFMSLGYLLYRYMNTRARNLSVEFTKNGIASSEKIIEVLTSYREAVVRNRRANYADLIGKMRVNLSQAAAEIAFMPNLSKYVIEVAVVFGALLIGASQFLTQDAVHAVGTITVFMAAGSRIAPAILRIQQNAVQIKGSYGSTEITLDLIERLKQVLPKTLLPSDFKVKHDGFVPLIEIENLSMNYNQGGANAMDKVTFKIENGQRVAIVGSSGAGKTTLVDLILGIFPPTAGKVLISNTSPSEAISQWPGAIAYVPQDITISNGTIGENVCLGFSKNEIDDFNIWEALKKSHLADFVQSLPLGLHTPVGERGTKLSGGQRQRLGIARALITKPKLLVLDEATSSLDNQTEEAITSALDELHGEVTIVLVAHRLSTVKKADQVIYLNEGQITAMGSFERVRELVPDFDIQAKLVGM
jgi:ABC-type multidrug transport system fused ATPase/permease subunit